MRFTVAFLMIFSMLLPGCAPRSYRLAKSGMALEQKGYLIEAEKKFSKALKINPNEPLALIGIGYVYYKKEMYDEAIASYKKGLEGHPEIAKENPEAHYYLGLAYNKKDMTEEARKEFGKYRKLRRVELQMKGGK